MSSTESVFLEHINKERWWTWKLIGWRAFAFSGYRWMDYNMKGNKSRRYLCSFWASPSIEITTIDNRHDLWLAGRFQFLLFTCCMYFNETWQKGSTEPLVSCLCHSEKWQSESDLAENIDFSFATDAITWTSATLSRKQIRGPNCQEIWLPWPLIYWHLFDLSSGATA